MTDSRRSLPAHRPHSSCGSCGVRAVLSVASRRENRGSFVRESVRPVGRLSTDKGSAPFPRFVRVGGRIG